MEIPHDSSNFGNPWAVRTHQEMRDVLMSPLEKGPENYYYMIRGGSDKKNITVMESGIVGTEYIKTYGHYHVDDLGEVYTILSGAGIVLMQERKRDDNDIYKNDEVESVKAVFVKAGSIVSIPPKTGHLIVNTGDDWLVTSDNSPVAMSVKEKSSWPIHADYEPVKEFKGFAYYVVVENGSPIFVKNSNYKNTPEIEIIYT